MGATLVLSYCKIPMLANQPRITSDDAYDGFEFDSVFGKQATWTVESSLTGSASFRMAMSYEKKTKSSILKSGC